jgi:hypothetical protein
MIAYVFENRPRYLLVDEIDKMVPKDHPSELNGYWDRYWDKIWKD